MSKRSAPAAGGGGSEDGDSSTSKRKRATSKESNEEPQCPVPLSWAPAGFNARRGRLLTEVPLSSIQAKGSSSDCVVLWMDRDMRTVDNHALTYARALALEHHVPLRVVFSLPPVPKMSIVDTHTPTPTLRQYAFMVEGLKHVERELRALHVPFHLLQGGTSTKTVPAFVASHHAIAVVSDFSPLRQARKTATAVAASCQASGIPMVEVDAHNVVPCFHASPKLEYSARTLRGKYDKVMGQYLVDDFGGAVAPNAPGALEGCAQVNWNEALSALELDRTVKPVTWLVPGTAGAMNVLDKFCEDRLKLYAEKRNDPNVHASSDLSPYFHFGHLSSQRAVLHVRSYRHPKHGAQPHSRDAFTEETVVRKELADNFCYYNSNYDNIDGSSGWAKESLIEHSKDTRQPQYSRAQLETAVTYDPLWNAAQLQMVNTAKMHGFLRMYWAKKILEWSPSPEEALSNALYFNDKYSLDGCDPNGFVGCMWSICGVHDMGWAERPIFGKIRYMNFDGCKRKFDIQSFIDKHPPARANATANKAESRAFAVVKKEKE